MYPEIISKSVENLSKINTPEMEDQIILTALSPINNKTLWLEAFSNNPRMIEKLIKAFDIGDL